MTSAGLTVVGTSAFYAYAHSCMHVALSAAAVATWWALINSMSYAERSQRCEEQLWLLLLLPLLALGFNDPVAAVNMAFLLQTHQLPINFPASVLSSLFTSLVMLMVLLIFSRLASTGHSAHSFLPERLAMPRLGVSESLALDMSCGTLLMLVVHVGILPVCMIRVRYALLAYSSLGMVRAEIRGVLASAFIWAAYVVLLLMRLLIKFSLQRGSRTHFQHGWQLRFFAATVLMAITLPVTLWFDCAVSKNDNSMIPRLLLTIYTNWYILTVTVTFWPSCLPRLSRSHGMAAIRPWKSAIVLLKSDIDPGRTE
jgi:hypothetical protein